MELASGEILFNNQKPSKAMRRKVGYVLQEDVFFSHLTVNQSLKVCMNLYLDLKLHT